MTMMKVVFGLVVALLGLLVAAPAHAQGVGQVQWNCLNSGGNLSWCPVSGAYPLPTSAGPASAATAGIAPVTSTAVAASTVIKSSPGNLYGLNVTAGATAGYVLVFNATSAPADGAVTPVKCYEVAANQTLAVSFSPVPDYFSTGIVAAFSSTGCYNKTGSATAFISGDAK